MDELYTYLGYILIAILFYLIMKTIFNKKSMSKEGFMGLFKETSETKKQEELDSVSAIEENIKNIQDATSKTSEQMNLVKNRKNWEELIVAMEDRINSASLQSVATLASMIKADPENEKLITIVGSLNELNKYKETLKENMKYLDGLK